LTPDLTARRRKKPKLVAEKPASVQITLRENELTPIASAIARKNELTLFQF
jgi:hypothetical protein